VGAGKTATMVMAAMELRRLGLAAKPAVVVPNHMLDQFSREWLQLYPTAKVLIADRDRLSKERRKEFVARRATGDWDGVIFTQAGFGRLPLGGDLLAGYMGEELARCREALNESRSGKSLSVKRLEGRIAQLEETYQRLMATETKDDGVHWTETGVDYIFCDEAHLYKNRRVDSAIDGMANPGSQRAQDLDAKLWALRRVHGPRVVTFATATPVANSIAPTGVAWAVSGSAVLVARPAVANRPHARRDTVECGRFYRPSVIDTLRLCADSIRGRVLRRCRRPLASADAVDFPRLHHCGSHGRLRRSHWGQ
jgi:N12 class adenine-specific DNA methylase